MGIKDFFEKSINKYRRGDNYLNLNESTVMSGKYKNRTAIKSISGDNVQEIESSAFEGCEELEMAYLMNAKRIGENAFRGCKKLESLSIPRVESIQSGGFEGCKELEMADLGSVTEIGENAFKRCKKLAKITMPKLETIRSGAFEECEELVTADLESVTKICRNAFKGCKNLVSINIPKLERIDRGAFDECESLISIYAKEEHCRNVWGVLPKNMRPKINIYTEGKKKWSFLSQFTHDEGRTFDLTGLKEITKDMFKVMSEAEVIFADDVEEIYDNTFENCKNLSSVSFEGATTIGEAAFRECEQLFTTNFPKTTIIKDEAFYECEQLLSINLPMATTIGNYVFCGCKNLSDVNIISVDSIGENVFDGCDSLTSLVVKNQKMASKIYKELPEELRENVKIICDDAPKGNMMLKVSQKEGIDKYVRLNNGLMTASLPSDFTEIKSSAMDRHSKSIQSVNGIGVEKIEEGTFKDFKELVEAYLPKLTEVPGGTFSGCEKLEKLTLGDAKFIANDALEECNALTSLTVKNEEAALKVYESLPENLKGNVATGRLKILLEKEGTNWTIPGVKEETESASEESDEGCIDKAWVSYGEYDSHIDGATIELPDVFAEISNEMLGKYKEELAVIKGEGVKVIREGAFDKCPKLFEADFPNAQDIYDGAFKGCEKLEIVYLGNLNSIGNDVFDGCTGLRKIHIGNEAQYDLVYDKLPQGLKDEVKIFVNGQEVSRKISPSVAELENGTPVMLTDKEVEVIDKELFKNIEDNVSDVTSITLGSLGDNVGVQEGIFRGFSKLTSIKVENNLGDENRKNLEDGVKRCLNRDVKIGMVGES